MNFGIPLMHVMYGIKHFPLRMRMATPIRYCLNDGYLRCASSPW